MNDTITIKIMSPVAVVWQVDALSVSAENSEGVFDILPDHARFMSLIRNTPVTIALPDSTTKTFTFKNAILFFEENNAVIYIQEPLRQISV
jgi:F0F1-type ATP synthase epsilon subunit